MSFSVWFSNRFGSVIINYSSLFKLHLKVTAIIVGTSFQFLQRVTAVRRHFLVTVHSHFQCNVMYSYWTVAHRTAVHSRQYITLGYVTLSKSVWPCVLLSCVILSDIIVYCSAETASLVWPPLCSSGQSLWLQRHRSRVRFPTLPDFLICSWSGRGPFGLERIIEELLERKSGGSGLENRDNGRRDPLHWPRNTLYPQRSALTSPAAAVDHWVYFVCQLKDTVFVVCSAGPCSGNTSTVYSGGVRLDPRPGG
jgi:hypothetical protein